MSGFAAIMLYGNIAMFEFFITKSLNSGLQRALILAQNISLFLVMLANHFFNSDGTGHSGFWPHSGGDHAKRESGRTPEWVKQ